jgi:hypothetical protein
MAEEGAAIGSVLACSHCGESLPDDEEAVAGWRHGSLVLAGELDRDATALLLCPDCDAAEQVGAYEEGAGD